MVNWVYDRAVECSGGATPGMVSLLDMIRERFPLPDLWPGYGYNCRKIAGSKSLSTHAAGRAYDYRASVDVPSERKQAERLVGFLTGNWEQLGVQEVIWNRRRWGGSRGPGWRPYRGSSPHTDHVHFAINAEAGANPDLGAVAERLYREVEAVEETGAGPVTVICPGRWSGHGRFPRWVVEPDGSVDAVDGATPVVDLPAMGVVPLAPVVDAQLDPVGGWLVLLAADGGTFALRVGDGHR